MSSELSFKQQLILAVVSGIVANGRCPDDEMVGRALKVVNLIMDQYPFDADGSGD